MSHRHFWTVLAGAVSLAGAVHAQSPTAAFLFAYDVDRGKQEAFEAGYMAHLGWHAAHGDTLPWYGWYVTSGPRTGVFVDGTFGIPFPAMDHRVDPAGDGADMEAKVLPFAKARTYSTLELWPEVSTARTLEAREPSAMLDAYTVQIAPARVAAFEAVLTRGERGRLSLAWYRLVSGGPAGGYLLLVPRQGWADLAGRPRDLAGLLTATYGPGAVKAVALIDSAEVETWSYRPKLSRLP
ncbi:hypothetical protein [Caulobacter sp. 1776]|uniref:hypothetical protein n=1 Tax=Caulobacter sp. 1776 TaxID=3156420 RepID=UPI00339A1A3F